ncbi:DUF6891 domain-containing protein [Nocardiopsis ganjiahuensis]|uniref:DUF6891 domain-containing protein n=1 Tax=Nocardiopsis ganjiahuensis TaxID=239984 RepID=UPI00034A0469|nr:hypothetical protein [Nocardiopsis ganjiahuensis]
MRADWSNGDRSLDALREWVTVMVAMGRLGFSDVMDRAYERLIDLRSSSGETLIDGTLLDGPAPDRAEPAKIRADAAEVHDFADRAFANHLRVQRRWPGRTDVDRLERAGQALAAIGVPLFEGVDCCDGCLEHNGGEPYVWSLADHQDVKARAVAYFFESDIELALFGEHLWISFAVREHDLLGAAAAEILEVLHAHGLDALWPDETAARIRVDMDWRCRRRGRLAAHPGPRASREPMIRVELTNPQPEHLLPWWGEDHLRDTSVREFARVALPWLPTGQRVEVTSRVREDLMIFLERDFDRIRVLGAACLSGVEPTYGEGLLLSRDHLDEVLSRWAVDGSLPSEDAPPASRGLLDVRYSDGHPLGVGRTGLEVPMELAELRSLLHRAVPALGTFVVACSFNGVCVQMVWQEDHTVWMETPDPVARVSYGRLGTLAEAEELFCQLAEEGTSGLLGAPGVHTLHWDHHLDDEPPQG